MKRARILFAGREIEFINRDAAIKLVEEFAEKGTGYPLVIYGPEGCGKTAFFRQTAEVLREYDYAVVHVNPTAEAIEEKLSVSEELKDLTRELGTFLLSDASKLIEKAIEVLYTAVRRNIRRRIALLADDIFQAIGIERAELLVKAFLNMIEWPSLRYERIVIFVASSEGITRKRVGRHSWTEIYIMWNMPKDGFKQLYNLLPEPKPPFEDIWRLTGGNPRYLDRLYKSNWSAETVIDRIIRERNVKSLAAKWRNELMKVIKDPDYLWDKYPGTEDLIRELIETNLIVEVWDRKPYFWIDEPPPEKDLELGIGREYAWQTPIHREAVRRVLEQFS